MVKKHFNLGLTKNMRVINGWRKLRITEDLKFNPEELQMQVPFGSFVNRKNAPKSDIKPIDESCKWVGKGGVLVLEVCLRQGGHIYFLFYIVPLVHENIG